MLLSLCTSALLALGTLVADAPANPTAADATHTLQLTAAADGCLVVDGVASESTVLMLASAHVATKSTGESLRTVTLPDGRSYFKGDFTLRIQSAESGTIDVQVCDGEAVLAALPSE